MANKFQKSVLQRLEEENLRKKSEPRPAAEPVPEPVQLPDNAQSVTEEITIQAASQRPATDAVPVQQEWTEVTRMPDLSAYLRPTPARRAKNKTFYLDTDVIDALQKAAKAQRVTDSKLCGDILRSVLGL